MALQPTSNSGRAELPSPKLRHHFAPEIRFHLPYERLCRRKAFGEAVRRIIKEERLLRLDNFALFDAVTKRGGFEAVCARGRWQEVAMCLQYETRFFGGMQSYYNEVLLAAQSELAAVVMGSLGGWGVLEGETLELHLLPPSNLTSAYYQLTPSEYLFAESHFSSFDQYFNLKTLVLSPSDPARIPIDFAEKFLVMKKWLLFSGQVKVGTARELRMLGVTEKADVKVAIVGISLAGLLVADRLSELGVSVILLEKGRRETRLRDDFQVVENGLMLLEAGNARGSYLKALEQSGVLLGQVGLPANGMLVLDEQGKPYAEQRIRTAEEYFFGIIEELKGEVNNRKNLYQQVVTRMIRRKLDYQRFLIRWHYDRYMAFNRIKGDSTTVADLAAYQGKKFIKHIAQGHSLAVVHSLDKLLARLRQRKGVTIVAQPLDHITRQADTWTLHTRAEPLTASYLVYADQEAVFRGVLDGSPRIAEWVGEGAGEAAAALQQLIGMKYINCLFRFRERLLLREPLKNQTCFSICCAHGFIYFFVLNSGTEILAVLKCYHTSIINYYSEILGILESKCLVKNNRLVNEELCAYEYTFGVRDQKMMEGVVRIRPRLFLLLPITTTNCPHRTAALLDLANYITSSILDEIHPNYHLYDQSLKEHFLKDKPKTLPRRQSSIREGNSKDVFAREGSISSIQNLASVRSFNEELPRINIITIIPNAPLPQEQTTTGDNQLPSVMALAQQQEDWFGLKHPLVRNHQLFVKSRAENMGRVQALAMLGGLALNEPIQLYPGLQLLSLGTPYLREQEWFSCILPTGGLPSCLFPLNGIITRREFLSLRDPLTTTIYFQTVLLIDQSPFYCIIDEAEPAMKFYHTDPSALVTAFIRHLQQARNQLLGETSKSYSELKISRCGVQPRPPEGLLLTSIEQTMREEVKAAKDWSLDSLLEKKLESAAGGWKLQPFMGADPPAFPPPFPAPTPAEIYREVSAYVEMMTRSSQLRPYSLFQIFFGYLSEQYMVCQLLRRTTLTPIELIDLQRMDEPLCREVQQVLSKEIPNQLYSFLAVPDDRCLYFHRNFLHPNDRRAFDRYTAHMVIESEAPDLAIRSFLLQGGRRKEFGSPMELMLEIISLLSRNYRAEDLVWHFRTLVNREIENEGNLTPRLKAYYRMAKRRTPQLIPPSNLTHFKEKCRDMDEAARIHLYNMMRMGRSRWLDDQMVLISK